MNYLALGDSYTYGEKVPPVESFPYQIVQKLRAENLEAAAPEIIAMTAWTTADLLDHLSRYKTRKSYNLCSLLIGVNNQYQGLAMDKFYTEYTQLVDYALQKIEQQSARLLLLTIPDWGLTPYNDKKDPKTVSQEIDLYNAYIKKTATKIDAPLVDICALSRAHGADIEYLVEDGLHPSAKAYTQWTEKILTHILNLG